MSKDSEKKEYVHWQDLAQQLGAEASDDLQDYFGGTASFAGELNDDDTLREDVAVDLTEPTSSSRETTDASEAAHQMNPQTKRTEPSTVQSTPRAATDATADSAADATPEPQPSTELVIDWGTDSASVPKKRSDKGARKKEKPKSKKTRAASKPAPVAPTKEQGHWDDLASSLGIAAPGGKSSPPEKLDESTETRQPYDSADSDAELIGTQADASVDQGAEPQDDESQTPIGVFEPAEELADENSFLEQMFVPPEQPFVDIESDAPSDFEDQTLDDEEPSGSFEAEREYIEFEIEELDPSGAGDSHQFGFDQDKTETQPRRRRRGGGSRGGPQRTAGSRSEESYEERPPAAKRKRERPARPSSRSSSEESVDGDAAAKVRRKQKKLPTWDETVNTIVDANLASRKKAPRRRGGRGRGRGNK